MWATTSTQASADRPGAARDDLDRRVAPGFPSPSESTCPGEHGGRLNRPPYHTTTRFEDLDLDFIHAFLSTSYWADGIPLEVVERACRGSLCFGLFRDGVSSGGSAAEREPVGFARVVSDYATFGYLADVFVTEPHRGAGLATWMVECVLEESAISTAETAASPRSDSDSRRGAAAGSSR